LLEVFFVIDSDDDLDKTKNTFFKISTGTPNSKKRLGSRLRLIAAGYLDTECSSKSKLFQVIFWDCAKQSTFQVSSFKFMIPSNGFTLLGGRWICSKKASISKEFQ